MKIVIQVNGKLRSEIDVELDLQEDEIKKIALEDENTKKHISDSKIKKIIYVPKKLINIVLLSFRRNLSFLTFL